MRYISNLLVLSPFRVLVLMVISLPVLLTNAIAMDREARSLAADAALAAPETPGILMRKNVCEFERAVADAAKALDHAKVETVRRGGTWEGDLVRGRYDMRTPFGALEGTYEVEQDKVVFSIQRKPALVPCALIATIIDQFIKP